MKKSSMQRGIRQEGILHLSTLCLLAGGGVSLTSCEQETTYSATPEDVKMAALESKLDEIEARRSHLTGGVLENNFEMPGLGFYHCEAQDFFPFRHGHVQDGKWFANGKWLEEAPDVPNPKTSRPSAVALEKVQKLLEREQELAKQSGTSGSGSDGTGGGQSVVHHHHGGSGVGSMLMMYWLLNSNRGGFTPGPGYNNAQGQQSGWQRSYENDRKSVSSYSAGNGGYSKLVQQSKAAGKPVQAGASVRGGFGSSGKGGSFGG